MFPGAKFFRKTLIEKKSYRQWNFHSIFQLEKFYS